MNPVMKKILFVTHEAARTGSPLNLLRFLRWLRKNTAQEFEVLVAKDGPLVADFAKLGPVHAPWTLAQKSESDLRSFLERFGLIYANSCCSAGLVESLPFGDAPIVTHVLEVMDDSIDALGLKNLAAMIRFIWIGGTRDFDLNRYLRRDIQRLGLAEQVAFVGELENPGSLLALSNVLCVTARGEALAMAMMETASLGVPVVYFDGAGGAGEFCSQGGGCGVPYLDTDAMAAKCREFMVNPGSAATMGRQGIETVRKGFSVDSVAPGLWNEVNSWLQRPPPMSPFRASGCSLGDIFASWNLDDSPDAEYVRATSERNTSFREARTLVDQGRLSEAVAVLIRAARPRSTRDLEGIQETLVDIGGELKRLDPKKGDYLMREAEKLGQMTGRSVEEIRADLPNNSRRPEFAAS